MTLVFELGLDILPPDLSAEIQVYVYVCSTASVVIDLHRHTERQTKLLRPLQTKMQTVHIRPSE